MCLFFHFFKKLLLFVIILGSPGSYAQTPVPIPLHDLLINNQDITNNFCSNDMILRELQKHPDYKAREEKINREIRNAQRILTGDTLTLPVVVHIINPNPGSITDLQVITGIQDLNDAFSKSGNYIASLGADTKIRFCISQKDPDGGNTTGITRTTSFFSNHLNMDIEDAGLKNLIQWDPAKYINIWLITSIDAEAYADFSCGVWYRLGVGGYATMPPGGGPLDGIVITGFGKLLAHEMGHYLGLYHTFQGGCNNYTNCLTDGDQVCDTPPDNSVRPSPSCTNPTNSCNTDTLANYSNNTFFIDVPDQISNFMDYGNTACSNLFTQGQADRMRAAIVTQRSGLLPEKCSRPCTANMLAAFTRNIAYPVIGDIVAFTNNSSGATSYEWLADGIPVSTGTNYSHTFTVAGKYKITLKAFNGDTCFAASSDFVIVTCGVTARFYTNKKAIASKIPIYADSIIFTNTSYNAQTYQWLITYNTGAETLISTNTNLTYIFPAPGTYRVRLIATNGSCSDTTNFWTVNVLDPTPDGAPYAVRLLCYQPNKVKVDFCIASYGYAPLPKNTPITFYNADPRLPGTIKLLPTFYLPYALPGGNCGFCFSHILNAQYHGIEKVYLVFNDSGNTVPVALPNTLLVESNYFNNIQNSQANRTIINKSICQGQAYAGYTTAGTYIDTLPGVINGCDSIRTLNLTIKPVFTTTVAASICQGQNYAGHITSGTYADVYTAVNGCDSTRTLLLTVKPTFATTVTASICQGQNYAGHTATGTFVDVYPAINGCDSTRTLHLTVKPVFRTTVTAFICQGQNYAGHITSGTYADVYTAVNGCDSTRTLLLTVKPTFATTVTTSVCQGQNYAGHTASGVYVDTITASNGCDSVRTLNLTVNPLIFATVTAAICQGQNYAGHTASGTYVDVYSAVTGCDSTRTLFLTIKPVFNTSISATICEGENYAGHTVQGNYTDVYTAINGCDSTRVLQLTVNPVKSTTLNREICMGQTYFAGGHLQTKTGTYFDTAQTFLSCDSVIVTHLLVHPNPVPDLGKDRGICMGDTVILYPGNFASYVWQDGTTNDSLNTLVVGTYSVKVIDTFGCIGSDTLILTRIYPLPVHFLPADSTLCKGNILKIQSSGYKSYRWSTGSDKAFIEVITTGTYRLLVTDRYDCKGTDSLKVIFKECVPIQIPNAFTPNKDGKNDTFKPLIPAPLKNYQIQILNRWGLQLFVTKNITQGWDGTYKLTEQPTGAYVYLITYTSVAGQNIQEKGTFMLIR